MSGYNSIAKVARNRIKRRSYDTPISGKGGYLDTGEHVVKVAKVDLSDLNTGGSLSITLEGPNQSVHIQKIWILKRGVDEYSPIFIGFINALFNDTEVYELLDELMADPNIQETTFKLFEGMQLRITIGNTDGYTIERESPGRFIITGTDNQEVRNRVFQSIPEAREYATRLNMKRAFKQVKRYEALADDILTRNRQHFDFATKGIREATRTIGDTRNIFNPGAFKSTT